MINFSLKPSDLKAIFIIHPKDVMSPIRDPAVTRNRFEGLLEGAIQFYSEHVEESAGPGTPEIVSSAAVYAAKIRENRGKSAIPFR